jgi:hypothetical protein
VVRLFVLGDGHSFRRAPLHSLLIGALGGMVCGSGPLWAVVPDKTAGVGTPQDASRPGLPRRPANGPHPVGLRLSHFLGESRVQAKRRMRSATGSDDPTVVLRSSGELITSRLRGQVATELESTLPGQADSFRMVMALSIGLNRTRPKAPDTPLPVRDIGLVAPLRLSQRIERSGIRGMSSAGNPSSEPRLQAMSPHVVAGTPDAELVGEPVSQEPGGGIDGIAASPAGTSAMDRFRREEPAQSDLGSPRKSREDVARTLPDIGEETWVMAPIRWSGTALTSGNMFQVSDGSSAMNFSNTGNFRLSSFVMAPYIAQWSASLGTNDSKVSSTASSGISSKGSSSAMDYGGGLELFPYSRFPFSANLSQSTSQSRQAENSGQTTNNVIGLRQQYRTEDGRDTFGLSYNRSTAVSQALGNSNSSLVSSLSGNLATGREFSQDSFWEGQHRLGANFTSSSVSTSFSGQNSQSFNSNLNHSWIVHEDLNFMNSLTFSRNQTSALQGNALGGNASNVLLGATAFTWRPFEENPLTLTGGGDFSQIQVTNSGQAATLQAMRGYLATNYRFNENLSVNGNTTLSSTTGSNGERILFNTQAAGVSYAGDPRTIWKFNYGWGASGSLSRSSSSLLGSFVSSSASLSHGIVRSIVIDESQGITLNANQAFSMNSNGSAGSTNSFTNGASASWSAAHGENLNSNVGVNYADTLSSGVGVRNHFQSATMRGDLRYQLSSRAALALNANFNWSRSTTGNTLPQSINGITTDPSAAQINGDFSLSYSHLSPFSVPNLSYSATATHTNSYSNQSIVGSAALSGLGRGSFSTSQLLAYRIGRLTFNLTVSTISQAGKESASIYGSIGRDFDGVFSGRW